MSSSEIQDVSVCPCMRTLLCLLVRFRMCPSVNLHENSPVSSSEIQDVSVCPTCMRTLLCLVVRFRSVRLSNLHENSPVSSSDRMCPSVQLENMSETGSPEELSSRDSGCVRLSKLDRDSGCVRLSN